MRWIGQRVVQQGFEAVESGFLDEVVEVKVFDFGRERAGAEEREEEGEVVWVTVDETFGRRFSELRKEGFGAPLG